LLDWFNGFKYFNQINLKSKYHQIKRMEQNIEKMAMRTMYGFYEILVMPFGLCNAPLTFMTFMNLVFHAKLNEIVIIFIDDIFVIVFLDHRRTCKTYKIHFKEIKKDSIVFELYKE